MSQRLCISYRFLVPLLELDKPTYHALVMAIWHSFRLHNFCSLVCQQLNCVRADVTPSPNYYKIEKSWLHLPPSSSPYHYIILQRIDQLRRQLTYHCQVLHLSTRTMMFSWGVVFKRPLVTGDLPTHSFSTRYKEEQYITRIEFFSALQRQLDQEEADLIAEKNLAQS